MWSLLVPRSRFTRNVLVLLSGTASAQAIPLAASPILTRIYTPEDFGVLAAFVAITTILASVANGRYELAIMLPESDEEALNVAAFALLIATSFSLVVTVAVFALGSRIADLLDQPHLAAYLYLVPPVVLLLGLFNVLNFLNTRLKNYGVLARAAAAKSLALVTVQIAVGLVTPGPAGLVAGQALSSATANARLLSHVKRTRPLKEQVSWVDMKRMGRRYVDFPKYSMWAGLANTAAGQAANLLISAFFSITTLGFYSIVQRVMGMPSALVGAAAGQVYFEEASAERRATGAAISAFNATVLRLVLLSGPAFLVLFFFSPALFALVFGQEWRVAGTYAQILAPMFAIRFVVSAVSNTTNVFERQRIALAWQVTLLAIAVGTLVLAHNLGWSFEQFLLTYSAATSAHYLLLFLILRKLAKGNP